MRSSYPLIFAQRNVQWNVVDVVVLASPPRDPIRSNTASGDASERCTRTAPRRLLLPRSSKWGGEIDWIYITTAWCNGGEFLRQGFAYMESGEREREVGQQLAARVWGEGRVRPLPTLYRGLA